MGAARRFSGAVEPIVGPEPREATFASSVIRLSCSEGPWPGQLRRSVASLMCQVVIIKRPQQFAIVDLLSQSSAVSRYVRGWSREHILDWLNHQGTLRRGPGNETYLFTSTSNCEAIFLLDGDRFTFIVDNTTVVPE
jgi:hypothetical protein